MRGETDIDKFTEAYIECALWSSGATDEQGNELENLDDYSVDDIVPEALAAIQRDCDAFQIDNVGLLDLARSSEYNGHDFWLTRNYHGAGFWDRNLGEVGLKLTEAAHVYGECILCIGDDGRIYIYGEYGPNGRKK